MVVHGFEGQGREEQNALTRAQTGGFVCNGSPQSIQEETLDRVIIKCAISIWNVQSVMARMPIC